jgi:hypothetical protein
MRLETAFALAQIEAGCDLIGIGDAAASLVSARVYEELVLTFKCARQLIGDLRSCVG